MTNQHKFIKLDEWAKDLIVDPLSKEPLTLSNKGDKLLSSYGAVYPVVDGIYDLRLCKSEITAAHRLWLKGQKEFERIANNWELHEKQDFVAERKGVEKVYEDIPIVGRCLDVGGHQGRLRAFLSSNQEYISCDPFKTPFDMIDKSKKLVNAYPFLLDSVNFVCCQAEHLPFRRLSFDTVHMRSVIDHFRDPELALKEAFRVVAPDGQLVVGTYCLGGKKGSESFWENSKEVVKNIFSYLGWNRWMDFHIWHPTFKELVNLLSACGFSPVKTHWQSGTNNKVCYIQAVKKRVI